MGRPSCYCTAWAPPGIPGSCKFRPFLIEAGFRVLAPDARGFGRSPFQGGRTTVAGMAGDMAALLTGSRAAPAHVVGISMGGALALQLAIDRPGLVSKLILVNTFARLRPERPEVFFYFALRFLLVHTLGLPAQAKFVARRIFPREEQANLREILYAQIVQADPKGYRAAMRALARFDLRSCLGEISHPTLVVTGELDNSVPIAAQRALALGIPGASHTILPGTGHAVIAEKPDLFNQTMLRFLCDH